MIVTARLNSAEPLAGQGYEMDRHRRYDSWRDQHAGEEKAAL